MLKLKSLLYLRLLFLTVLIQSVGFCVGTVVGQDMSGNSTDLEANGLEISAESDSCSKELIESYDLSLHIFGTFIILVVSGMGMMGTVFLSSMKFKGMSHILQVNP